MSHHQTPAAAVEILAREMFVEDSVARGSDLVAAHWREYWYLHETAPGRERWRRRAEGLVETLAASDLS
jgi:hypothetical protein